MDTRLTRWQFATVSLGFLIGSSPLIAPMGPSPRDSWMCTLLAGAAGAAFTLGWVRAGQRWARRLPADYFRHAWGPVFGTFLALCYVWFCLHLGSLVVRDVVESYMTVVFVNTPRTIVTMSFVFLSVAAVVLGVEGFARSTEVITPAILAVISLVTSLTFLTPGAARISNLLPVVEHGLSPILKGTLASFSFPFGETIVLMSFLPFVGNQRRFLTYALVPVGIAALVIAVIHVRNIAVLGGEECRRVVFPSLISIQMIDIARFIQRLDALVLFAWTFGCFVKTTACLFAVVYNLARVLHVPEERLLVIPAALTMAMFSMWLFKSTFELLEFTEKVWPVYATPFEIGLPALALLAARRIRN